MDAIQRQIAKRVHEGGPGTLLISELAPVITTGRRTPSTDFLMSQEDLTAQGIELYPTDRGGLATYHGPGQWVLFPVDTLQRLTGDTRGVRKLVNGLLEVALEVARFYRSDSEIRSGMQTGVWTLRGKIASVGIHIEKGVVLHGLSINGFRTPESFMGIRPCGSDAGVDYLLKKPDDFEALRQKLLSAMFSRFWLGC